MMNSIKQSEKSQNFPSRKLINARMDISSFVSIYISNQHYLTSRVAVHFKDEQSIFFHPKCIDVVERFNKCCWKHCLQNLWMLSKPRQGSKTKKKKTRLRRRDDRAAKKRDMQVEKEKWQFVFSFEAERCVSEKEMWEDGFHRHSNDVIIANSSQRGLWDRCVKSGYVTCWDRNGEMISTSQIYEVDFTATRKLWPSWELHRGCVWQDFSRWCMAFEIHKLLNKYMCLLRETWLLLSQIGI